jgi:predicted GNAT family acetyltransferase
VLRTLFADVRRRAAEAADGVCGLRLYVEKENAAARAAYDALGMTETSYCLCEVEA